METDDVFDLLDLDGDGYLSRSASALLWEQFWISADPSEPGTVMCGPHPGAVTALPAGGRRPTCVTRPPGGRPGPARLSAHLPAGHASSRWRRWAGVRSRSTASRESSSWATVVAQTSAPRSRGLLPTCSPHGLG
ncbi:hypothetical protein ACGF13_32795 [Kitasatospora sp. NPDC048286]|uniref:hypothetical protein n=1 Tax=Kitasatospora sp. NPDC048286 TaxID=3364047 RepID=UPI0037178F10